MENYNKLSIKNVDYVHRQKASYEEDVLRETFKTEEESDNFKATTLEKHATWIRKKKRDSEARKIPGAVNLLKTDTYYCDHYGSKSKKKGNNAFYCK
jgi:uncharacterized protein (UPF0305 family)